MINSKNRLTKEELAELNSKLRMAISIASGRLGTELSSNIDECLADIISKFGHIKSDRLITAIRNGSCGDYGRTYRFCTQEIGIWINAFVYPKQDRL